jgi:RNA polymerase II C-terminal domain phosphatase-like 3/4
LILDLDHTLLNSTQFKELTQEQHDLLHECIAREAEGLKEGQRPMLYCLRHMGFFTKLRPHVFEFLESVSKICQPYVYTMGDKPYAREMVKLIDPEGTIFHGRVISNNDSTSSHVKDLDIVLGGEASAIIVDDTERVWPQNQGNLIRLDRYHFFPGSASSFQQKGQSVMESSMVDEGELGSVGSRAVLLDVLAVIESVHRSFFKNTDDGEEPDVRKLLIHPDRADLPLSGVKFMMSGVTTLGDRRPERHPLRLLASTLGAEFASSIERDGNTVTHVIARSSGTDKVKWARKTSGRVFVVEPGWLVACARANTRVSESLYELQ